MSLAVAIIRSRSKGLEAESKITYVHKLCSRRQAKEMSSETNVCSRRSLENPGEEVSEGYGKKKSRISDAEKLEKNDLSP
ncbi:hypothetical protein TNIN_397191 [Trichonephila inaurata madagascariensis]|uniref:Uncharacterized protein n=1 Tax=Trichonephila inaurata madagascariensis TaxID=2747483 RepID=A0A8X6XBG9_9ARAC|nr:hypothetical protein TNIN_397191 [Trichonephila inaurata madagascariensis]